MKNRIRLALILSVTLSLQTAFATNLAAQVEYQLRVARDLRDYANAVGVRGSSNPNVRYHLNEHIKEATRALGPEKTSQILNNNGFKTSIRGGGTLAQLVVLGIVAGAAVLYSANANALVVTEAEIRNSNAYSGSLTEKTDMDMADLLGGSSKSVDSSSSSNR